MADFSLSDLVMLQMVGGLDRFTAAVMESGNAQQVIEDTRRKATTPHLFPEIVRKTIEMQFSDPATAVRELGQNARDAYSLEQVPKIIEFVTKREDKQLVLSCRDYGIGMQLSDVLRNLLIPYNSGKEFDHTKIGEHGIGWFSVMDISKRVKVRTRNGIGALTYAALARENDGWTVSLDVKDEPFKGTEIVMYLDDTKLDESKVAEGLRRHLGFAHPTEVNLTLNGEKVNTLASEYVLAGEALVENKGLEGRLRLHMAKQRYNNDSDLLTITQNGLYVKDLGNPFEQKSLHYELFDKLRRYGVYFWVDLPSNVGLTKGRNNVIADDVPKITEAMYPAFEQAVLDVIMEDENLVQKLDHVIAEVVGKIFEKTYATTKVKVRDRLMAKLRELKEQATPKLSSSPIRGELPSPVDLNPYAITVQRNPVGDGKVGITVSGSTPATGDRDYFLEIAPRAKSKAEQEAENKRKQYLTEVTGLSKDMITKRFIPSFMVDSHGVIHSEKISIEDMIVAYEIGALRDETPRLASPQGVYVNRNNAIVNKVYDLLHREAAEITKLRAATEEKQRAKELVARIEARSAHLPTEITPTQLSYLIRDEPRDEFERTGLGTFQRIVQLEGIGREYLTFFEVMNYLDWRISTPNKMERNVHAIHDKRGYRIDIAHTNYEGISFNLQTSVIQQYMEAIREGTINPKTLASMLELMLHEKAHCRESYSSHLSHGNDFFVVRMKGLRDTTLTYFQNKGIDPLADANKIVQGAPKVEHPLYRGERLAGLVRKHKE